MAAVPTYLPYYVLAGSIAVIVTIVLGLRAALVDADWPPQRRNATVFAIAMVLMSWFVLSLGLGVEGAYEAAPDAMPTIQYGIILPILIGAALIWRSVSVRSVIEAVPQSWLVGVQLYRALGVIFLILYAGGHLPGLFAWPAGVGDIAIGLLAPLVGIAYARNPRQSHGLVAAWNILGVLDLVVAVTTGFITSPSLLQPIAIEPPNLLMSIFPMVLIPVYLVPLSILLHVASLAKLRWKPNAVHAMVHATS